MSDTATIFVAVLGSGAFTVIVNAIVELLKNAYGKKSSTDKAINFTLLFCLEIYGQRLLDKQEVDREEILQFEEMYKLYKKRGGNGYADKLKEEIDNLPGSWRRPLKKGDNNE